MTTYYHVTLRCNLPSIQREGISPRYAAAKRGRSFYVREGGITWAIAHVAARHGVSPKKLVILSVDMADSAMRRVNASETLFYCERVVTSVCSIISAMEFLQRVEDALESAQDS